MASRFPSLEELLRSVSEKTLEKPCSDEHIVEIACKLTDWRLIAPHLGLKAVDEENILQNHHDVRIQRREMLRTWRQKLGSKATYCSLAKALYKTERVDLVEKVVELLTKVAELQTEVAELQTEVAELLTKVAELQTEVDEPQTKAAATSSLKVGPSFELPPEYSAIVKEQKDELLEKMHLESGLQDFRRVGKFVYWGIIAYRAAGSNPQFVGLRIMMKDLGYDIAQLCDKSARTAALASGSILADLQCTLFAPEMGPMTLETLVVIAKVAVSMADTAEELNQDFEKQTEKAEKMLEDSMVARGEQQDKSKRGVNMAEAAVDVLYKAIRVLRQLHIIMHWKASFWWMLQKYCQDLAGSTTHIQKQVERIQTLPECKQLKVRTSKVFKIRTVEVYAAWVALNGVCTKYISHIKRTERDLYEYLKENPTYEQSRSFLPELAKDLDL